MKRHSSSTWYRCTVSQTWFFYPYMHVYNFTILVLLMLCIYKRSCVISFLFVNFFTVHEVGWDWYLTNSEIPPIFQGLVLLVPAVKDSTGFPGECHLGPNLPRYREGTVVWVIGPLQAWEGSFKDLIKSSHALPSFTFLRYGNVTTLRFLSNNFSNI